MIATDAFQAYQKATGATMDNTTGLLTITEEQYNNLQPLVFNIGGTDFELSPNAQIWPRSVRSFRLPIPLTFYSSHAHFATAQLRHQRHF